MGCDNRRMTVYAVMSVWVEGATLCGVYSSEEAANAAAKEALSSGHPQLDWTEIVEVVIDAAPVPLEGVAVYS